MISKTIGFRGLAYFQTHPNVGSRDSRDKPNLGMKVLQPETPDQTQKPLWYNQFRVHNTVEMIVNVASWANLGSSLVTLISAHWDHKSDRRNVSLSLVGMGPHPTEKLQDLRFHF